MQEIANQLMVSKENRGGGTIRRIYNKGHAVKWQIRGAGDNSAVRKVGDTHNLLLLLLLLSDRNVYDFYFGIRDKLAEFW